MNVGIVTTWHEGGAGYVSRAYMNALSSQGHSVFIYARGGKYYPIGDPIWDLPNVTWGIRYLPLDRISKFTVQYVNQLHFENWLNKNKIDIVITNEDQSFELARRTKGLGYIIGTYIDYYKEDTLYKFDIYDFLLCNTRRHHSVFKEYENTFYVPWGTDISLFRPPDREKKEADEVIAFFHSANFSGINCRKGTDLLLEAFQKVKGPARLIIHSQAPLSRFGDVAAEIVRSDPRVEFIEKTVPAPGLYHLGDVFVYPSRLEGIGLCIPEALSCGLPVITTNCAPMTEFVEHGTNGLLVRVKETRKREDDYYWPETIADVNDLASQMQAYVDNREMLISHKKRARESAEKNLSWMRNASTLGQQLMVLTNRPDRRRRPTSIERMCWRVEAGYVRCLTGVRIAARKILKRPPL